MNIKSREKFTQMINWLLKDEGISPTELARRINYPPTTVYNWCQGVRFPKPESLEDIANYFNVLPSDLISDDINNKKTEIEDKSYINNFISIPLLLNLSAGSPDELIESDEIAWIPKKEFQSRKKNLIAAKVNGDSMNKVFPSGSIVVLEKVEQLKNGEIGAFLIDEQHDATIKRFRMVGNAIVLSPESTNSIHQDIYLDLEQHSVKVIGKLVYYILPGDIEF